MWPLNCSLDMEVRAAECTLTGGDSSTTGAIIRDEIKREYG